MATPSKFEVSVTTRLAVIEEHIKPKDRAALYVVLAAVLTVMLSGIGWWGWWVSSNMVAIKQQLQDGGNKAIVSSLDHPESLAVLRADLLTVIASVQTAQAHGTKADPKKTIPLSLAVDKVVKGKTPPNEAWQAASQLINYRSGVEMHQELPPCKLDVRSEPITSPVLAPPGFVSGIRLDPQLKDCTLVIDSQELADLWDTAMSKATENIRVDVKHPFVHYNLLRVHVVYNGGPIYASTIEMRDCSFEFRVDAPPSSKNGRVALQSLLEASNLDAITIAFATEPKA